MKHKILSSRTFCVDFLSFLCKIVGGWGCGQKWNGVELSCLRLHHGPRHAPMPSAPEFQMQTRIYIFSKPTKLFLQSPHAASWHQPLGKKIKIPSVCFVSWCQDHPASSFLNIDGRQQGTGRGPLNIKMQIRIMMSPFSPVGGSNFMFILANYQALLWWIFQTGKFLREKATLI